MTHPEFMAELARQRQADLLREAASYRLARSAADAGPRTAARPSVEPALRLVLRVAAACFPRWSVRW